MNDDYVQSDLANQALLVFDFSESVQGYPDEADELAAEADRWQQARVELTEITVNTKCKRGISFSNEKKYHDTVIAIRESKLV